jgi:putative tryptophan/tyrosine transport system substrate-binding protein
MKRREFIAGLGAAVGWPFGSAAQGLRRKIGFLTPRIPNPDPKLAACFPDGLRQHGWISQMMRRQFLAILVGGLLAVPALAHAQLAGEPRRVGVLSPQKSNEPATVQREPFERGLQEHGWKIGSNLVVYYRYADGDVDRLPALAIELVQNKVEVIVTRGPQATLAAHRASGTMPIVMSATPNPVSHGFAQSLSHPGGSITGLSFLAERALDEKRLQLLKEAVPNAKRVAVLTNPAALQDPDGSVAKAIVTAAAGMGLDVRTFEIKSVSALPDAFAAIHGANADVLLVRADPHILEPRGSEVVALARQYRLPVIYPWQLFYVDVGGLMSYGTNVSDFHHRSADFVDRILRGARPGDLPIEQPTKFDLVVNLRAAREIGLTLPPLFLTRADEVIE